MKLRYVLVGLMLLPRMSVTYLFYIFSTFLLLRFNDKRANAVLLTISSFLLFSFFINIFIKDISPTGFLLEFLFIFPLLALVSFCPYRLGFTTAIASIRILNVSTFILSLFSMMKMGFPFSLPYIHFAPDYFNALYGLGGAKIVTIFGYFGVLTEILLSKKQKTAKLYIFVAFLNFLIPSYIIGILAGMLSFLPFIRKNKKFIIILAVIISLITPYIIFRLNQLGFSNISSIPKIKAYIILFDLYIEHPQTIFFGTGLGQFISQSALWSSSYIAELSTHSIPNLPLFYMSDYHKEFFGPIFLNLESFWMISSSAQKPYNSIVSLYAETGLFFASTIFLLLVKRVKDPLSSNVKIAFIIFVFTIFSVDVWHDNIFFLFIATLFSNLLKDEK